MAAGAAALVAEMVVAAVVQEAVTRGTSYVISKLTEDAADASTAEADNVERAETAHARVELVLERSAKLPITERVLLRSRKKLKRAYEECSDRLQRCKQPRAAAEDRSRLRRVKSYVTSFFASCDGELSSRDVQRFELAAALADRYMSDVETGATLRQYMPFSPLIRQLVDGRSTLRYRAEQGGQTRDLFIWPVRLDDRGVEAMLVFYHQDLASPARSFYLRLMLRLSESTNVVETAWRCLRQSFAARQLKPLAEAAMEELCQLPTQDIAESDEPPLVQIQEHHVKSTWLLRPDPLCCKASSTATITAAASNRGISSELSVRLPEEVISVFFCCSVQGQYDVPAGGSTSVLNIGQPHLELSVMLEPHWTPRESEMQGRSTIVRETGEPDQRDVALLLVEEMVLPNAMDHFGRLAEATAYSAWWYSAHGSASFWVTKMSAETR